MKLQVNVVRVYDDPGRVPGELRVLVDRLDVAGHQPLVLLTAARDVEHSGAVVLRAVLEPGGVVTLQEGS